MWRNVVRGGRPVTLLSERGREYRKSGLLELKVQPWESFSPTARIRVSVWVYAADKRKRDVDNLFKGIGDLLTHAGIYADDSQIDDLRVIRAGYGGYVLVKLETIEGGLL